MAENLLHADDLYGCHHRFLLNRLAQHKELLETPTYDVTATARARHSLYAERVYQQLHQEYQAVIIPPGEDACQLTLEAVERGERLICGAHLAADVDAGRTGATCILMREPDTYYSAAHYTPVIPVEHRTIDWRKARKTVPGGALENSYERPWLVPHLSRFPYWDPRPHPTARIRPQSLDQMRLIHLWLLMHTSGIPATGQGGAYHHDNPLIAVHWLKHSLPLYIEEFITRQDLLDTVQEQLEKESVHEALSHLPTESSRRRECDGCGWWSTRCRAELIARNDVSLVVTGAQADLLDTMGIHTIHDLAHCELTPPRSWPNGDFFTSVARARAITRGQSLMRTGRNVTIPHADIEIDIDMEAATDGAYLWGTLLSYTTPHAQQLLGEQSGYRPFVTWSPLPSDDIGRVFVEMWEWLSDICQRAEEQGLSCIVYCFGQHGEVRWMESASQNYCSLPGMPSNIEVDKFLHSSHWVDLFPLVEELFIGVRGLGLKKVAPEAGFRWRDDTPSGELSISWHAQATGAMTIHQSTGVELEEGISEEDARSMIRQRILTYNEDDVRATHALRQWLREGLWKKNIPTRNDLLTWSGE